MTGNSKAGRASAIKLIAPDGDLIISIDDLLPGDILLCRPRVPKIHQKAITRVTGSPYTHAAIYAGNGTVAESNFRGGVKKNSISGLFNGSTYVTVIRSQMGFGAERAKMLNEFIDAVVGKGKFYDSITAASFPWASESYFSGQLQFINDNYGEIATSDELAQKRFICSAFVVACYTAVGIIGDTAQVAYVPEHFSPGRLAEEATFGWLLGYLVPEGEVVPPEERNRFSGVWRDIVGDRWWE